MASSDIGTQNMEKVPIYSNLVLANFKLKKIPFNVKFHPSGEKQNIFICASSNKKIMQFDVNTGKKEIDYAGHTGTVNTVTWIE